MTAGHLIKDMTGRAEIQLLKSGCWDPVQAELIGHSADVDISVVAVDHRLTPANLPLEPTSQGLIYGQEVFFMGFPYDLLGNVTLTEAGYHLPFVKRATMSCGTRNGFFLDGHNNPGFSGGPVVFTVPNENRFRVAAVVSAYVESQQPVYADGQETPLSYPYNTGIMVTYNIKHAVDLISSNPIGFLLH